MLVLARRSSYQSRTTHAPALPEPEPDSIRYGLRSTGRLADWNDVGLELPFRGVPEIVPFQSTLSDAA